MYLLPCSELVAQIFEAELEEPLPRACCVYAREFVREKKYKTEAEAFGWSFVFEDFVSEELKKKVTQKLEVNLNPMMSLVLLFHLRSSCLFAEPAVLRGFSLVWGCFAFEPQLD